MSCDHHHHQQQQQQRRQVCLFGTSANPPTGIGGHMGVVQALIGLKQFDEILVMPVYSHMFGAKRGQLVPFTHRVNMCRLALEELMQNMNKNDTGEIYGGDGSVDCDVENHSDGKTESHKAMPAAATTTTKVSVSTAEELCYHQLVAKLSVGDVNGNRNSSSNDREKDPSSVTKMEEPNGRNSTDSASSIRVGTADLLEMLQQQHPDTDYTFCLGGDTFLDLVAWKWKRSRDVLKLLDRRLVVIHRKAITTSDGYVMSGISKHDSVSGDISTIDEDQNDDTDDDESKIRRLLKQRVDIVNTDPALGRDEVEVDNDNDDWYDDDHHHESGDNNTVASNRKSTDANTIKRPERQPRGGRVQLLDVPTLENVSSSMARTIKDPVRLKEILPAAVVEYIMDHNLYSFSCRDGSYINCRREEEGSDDGRGKLLP